MDKYFLFKASAAWGTLWVWDGETAHLLLHELSVDGLAGWQNEFEMVALRW